MLIFESVKTLEFNYLGSRLTNAGESGRDIRNSIRISKKTLIDNQNLLLSKNISLAKRKQCIHACIWNIHCLDIKDGPSELIRGGLKHLRYDSAHIENIEYKEQS